MDLRNCGKCGRLFQYVGNPYCARCVKEVETEFQKVKKYLRKNPGASISEVVEETEVEASKIMKFLREGRLEIKNSDHYILDCESCGKKIPSGRLCKECKSGLERDIASVTGRNKKEEKRETRKTKDRDRFRIADRYRKG